MLAAASRRADDFSEEDVNFLEGIAQTLAAAVDRERAAEAIRVEQERLTEALNRASEGEARFRELADAAPAFIWTADPEGMVDFINRGWLGVHGARDRGRAGRHLGARCAPRRQARGSARPGGGRCGRRVPWEREYRLRRHDGVYRWIVDRGVPRFDGDRWVGYVGTATDIHERKEMERKLSEAYERDHEVAETLQRSLLPESLPRIEGLAWPRATCPPAAARRSGATGTTPSSWRTGAWPWWWATWWVTACAPPW